MHHDVKTVEMPSRVNAYRQRSLVNGMVSGSQPPPSTLIAALAPVEGSSFPQFDPGDFALLLKESLGSDEDGQPNLGNDVTLNHKLICVIVKAGLDTINLRGDDPFSRDSDYYDQLQGCLNVIELVVERTPEALFILSKSEDLGPLAENVPLFFWAIPKLLSLFVLDTADSKFVAQNVWPLLGKMLASAQQCPNSLGLCVSISAYLEELVEGTVHEKRRGLQV